MAVCMATCMGTCAWLRLCAWAHVHGYVHGHGYGHGCMRMHMATATATGMHAHGLSYNQQQVIMGLAHFYIIRTSWYSSTNISWKLSNYKTIIITCYYNGKYAWVKWHVNRHGYMHGCMATQLILVASRKLTACWGFGLASDGLSQASCNTKYHRRWK